MSENDKVKIEANKEIKSQREYWVDNIRVTMVLFVVLYHVLCGFSEDLYLLGYPFVWNETFIDGIKWVLLFFDSWQMHILFLLAGFSMVFSLKKRNYKEFAKERVTRLGIPLMFGYIIWIALLSYISIRFFWKIQPDLAPYIFQTENPPSFGTYYIWGWWAGGMVYPGHLWFLLALLPLNLIGGKIVSNYLTKKDQENQNKNEHGLSEIISATSEQIEPVKSSNLSFGSIGDRNELPEKKNQTSIEDSSKSIIFHPAMMILYGIIGAQIDGLSIWIPIGAFQYAQIIFFGLGISLAMNYRYLSVIQKHCKWTFPVALVIIIGYILLVIIGIPEPVVHTMRVIGAFYLVYSLIGLISKYTNKPCKFIKNFSKASMSIYILHLPLLNVIGYFICPIPFNPFLKICILFLFDVGLCLGIFEIFKRIRIKPIQLCIGIKL